MYQHNRLDSDLTFIQKVKNLDYTLLLSIIILSIISLFVMYSTDGGEILYHTKSHFIKLLIFFPLMLIISFFNIKFWHITSYLFYFIIISMISPVIFFIISPLIVSIYHFLGILIFSSIFYLMINIFYLFINKIKFFYNQKNYYNLLNLFQLEP